MELCITNRFSNAATIAATGFMTNCVDTLIASGPNEDNQLDPLGAYINLGTIAVGAGVTYQAQVITDSNVNGVTTPVVVADTGTMIATSAPLLDARLNNPNLFLAIDWSLVTQRYIMVKLTLAGGGVSFGFNGAWLVKKSDVPANVNIPANYSF